MVKTELGAHCIRGAADTCVIFVHGILSHGERAWTGPSGMTWPELLVSEEKVSDVAVYSFSYRTDVFSKSYSISDAANSIREFFALDEIWTKRRVIFVCHSMGGIVARRFIVANQAAFIERGTEIGLFLVASPSLGSMDANGLALLARLLRHSQAEALRFSQSNDWLNDLDRDFLTLKDSRNIWIEGKELYEDEPIIIKKFLFLWTQTVEPWSAVRYFGKPDKVPRSDHISISKPEDCNAIQHKQLVYFIRNLTDSGRASDGSRTITNKARGNVEQLLRALNDRPVNKRLIDPAALSAFGVD